VAIDHDQESGVVISRQRKAVDAGVVVNAIVGYVDGEYHSDIDLAAAHINRLQIFGISNVRLKREERAQTTRGFERDILPAIVDGRITPLVDRIFGFDELPAAKRYIESNAMVGKVVVKVV